MRQDTRLLIVLGFALGSVLGCGDDTASDGQSSAGGSGGYDAGGSSADGGSTTGGATAGAPTTGGSGGGSGSGASGAGGTTGGSAGTGGGSAGGTAPTEDECLNMDPDWIFCTGFEEGNLDLWDDWDGNPPETNLLLSAPGPFDLADNTVMELIPPAGRGGADVVKVLPSTHDALYARWYIRYVPGFDFNAANHGGGLHAGDRDLLGHSDDQPSGADWFSAWSEYDSGSHTPFVYSYYRGMYQDCVDPQGQCWGDHFPCTADDGTNYCEKPQHREDVIPHTLETGRWYCVELLLDGGTPVASDAEADGIINFWYDGVQLGPWSDLWLRTTPDLQINILWLSLFHHDDAHADVGVQYDNVVVSTSRIGCP